MTDTPRPGRPPGLPKTGGRKVGSLDKQQRQVVNDKMANDILSVYKKLGGVKFLLSWAKDNPSEFMRQCWARLAPAFPKDGADVQVTNQSVNIDMSDPNTARDVACRLAYVLAKGMQAAEVEPDLPPLERQVIEPAPLPEPHADVHEIPEPGVYGPAHRDYAAWAASLRQTPEEAAQAAEIHGSSLEQGVGGLRSGYSSEPPTTVRSRPRGRR